MNRQDSCRSLLCKRVHSVKVSSGFEYELRDLGVNEEFCKLVRNILKIVVAIASVGALAIGHRDANIATNGNWDWLLLLTWDAFGRSLPSNICRVLRRNNSLNLVRLFRSILRHVYPLLCVILLESWFHCKSFCNSGKLLFW